MSGCTVTCHCTQAAVRRVLELEDELSCLNERLRRASVKNNERCSGCAILRQQLHVALDEGLETEAGIFAAAEQTARRAGSHTCGRAAIQVGRMDCLGTSFVGFWLALRPAVVFLGTHCLHVLRPASGEEGPDCPVPCCSAQPLHGVMALTMVED